MSRKMKFWNEPLVIAIRYNTKVINFMFLQNHITYI